jgi:hypothetical protein
MSRAETRTVGCGGQQGSQAEKALVDKDHQCSLVLGLVVLGPWYEREEGPAASWPVTEKCQKCYPLSSAATFGHYL